MKAGAGGGGDAHRGKQASVEIHFSISSFCKQSTVKYLMKGGGGRGC